MQCIAMHCNVLDCVEIPGFTNSSGLHRKPSQSNSASEFIALHLLGNQLFCKIGDVFPASFKHYNICVKEEDNPLDPPPGQGRCQNVYINCVFHRKNCPKAYKFCLNLICIKTA